MAGEPGLHGSPSNCQRTCQQPSCSSSAEVANQGGGGSRETGPEGVCCIIQTPGWHAPGSRSSAMWSNLGRGWQVYSTRTETAEHRRGWEGSYWSSSSLCNIIRAQSDTQYRNRRPPQSPHPFRWLLEPPPTPPSTPSSRWPPPSLTPPLPKNT